MPATYDPIATTTLGSSNSTITFTGIPATFTDLRLVLVGTGTASGTGVTMRFNGDTGTNYSDQAIWGDGSSVNYTRTSSNNLLRLSSIANFGTVVQSRLLDIFNYAASNFKTILSVEGGDVNGTGSNAVVWCGMWSNTAAITSITITTGGNAFAAGTQATIYGILRA